MNLSSFKKERNRVLANLDVFGIMRLMKMDGRSIPPTEREFWLTVHKARVMLPSMPLYKRNYSRRWLKENDPTFNEQEFAAWF